MSYTHLTREERYQIYALKKTGHSQRRIAAVLGRNPATVSRELARNRGRCGYRPRQAHECAEARQKARERTRIATAVWMEIERLLALLWSPEQIAWRLWEEQAIAISHEWIYCYVWADKRGGGSLYRHLRCQKRRRKRYGAYSRRGTIPDRVSIDERPAIVASRQRLGDWEGDTVIGHAHRGALLSLVERKSRYTLIAPLARKTAQATRRAITQHLARHAGKVHTLTFDNGREFTDHTGIARDLKARVYFAHPYASWERGANENTNGLIRQYFPKRRTLHELSRSETQAAMQALNHRPRKALGFRTPHEVFFNTHTTLTVALES
ncbi:MAG: IS30 family transposase [Gammaproteobacteria bacterium]